MLQHDQLFDRLLILDDRSGDLLEIPAAQAGQQFVNYRKVLNAKDVLPDYVNLLAASGLMYQQLNANGDFINELLVIAKQAKATEMLANLENVLASIRKVQLCALDGVENVL